MALMQDRLLIDITSQDGYSLLYRHLLSVRPEPKYRTDVGTHHALRGYGVLVSARPLRSWWHSSMAGADDGYDKDIWSASGVVAQDADIGARKSVLATSLSTREGLEQLDRDRPFNLDQDFPSWDPGPWPNRFTTSREQIYDDMGRLTGGPADIRDDSS